MLCLSSSFFFWVDELQEQRPDLCSRTVLAALAQYALFSVARTGASHHMSWGRPRGRVLETLICAIRDTGWARKHMEEQGLEALTPARICARSAGKSLVPPDSLHAACACSAPTGVFLCPVASRSVN